MSERACEKCGTPSAHLHHALPRSICPEGVNEPRNFIWLCFACHMGWHDHGVTVERELFGERRWTWIVARASERWLDEWYPARASELPF